MAKKEKKEQEMFEKEMTLEESKAWRASLVKPANPEEMKEEDAREAWRLYWAQEKSKWADSKELELIIWLHLKAIGMAIPSKFEKGILHFGLKRAI